MSKYIPFILFTVLTNAAAQVMLKQGMLSICRPRHVCRLDGLAPVRPVEG
jgi:hypothetical protein